MPMTESGELARRIQLILKHGGTWLPPQTMATFASSKMPDTQLLATVESVRKAMVKGFHSAGLKADDGWKQFSRDPVLEKDASLALAVKRYVSGAIGPWPLQDADLVHIQKRLKAQGFAHGLHSTGVWSSDWDNEYRQWTDHLFNEQLAGKKQGSLSFQSALNALGAVLPKPAINATVGFFKALPHAGRQAIADLAAAAGGVAGGGAASRGAAAAGGFVMGQTPEQYQSDVSGRQVVGFQGSATPVVGDQRPVYAPNTHAAPITHFVGRFADDVGTLLLTHDALKLGTSVSKAVGEGMLKRGAVRELTEAEAARAGGVIAAQPDPAVSGAAKRFYDAKIAGSAAERQPGVVGKILGRAVGGDTQLFANMPEAAHLDGWVGKAADTGRAYYRARSFAALPYLVPGVETAGRALGDIGITGAKMRAEAAIVGGAGGTNLRGVNTEHAAVLNTADDAIRNHLDFTVRGHHIQPSLDDIAFLLHGPTHGAHTVSARVGDRVDDVVNGYSDALGRVGFSGAFEQATNVPTHEAVAHFGGEENFVPFVADTVYKHAANWWADQHIKQAAKDLADPVTGPVERGSEAWKNLHRDLAYEARFNDDVIHDAARGLLAQGGGDELVRRIHTDVTNSRLSAVDYYEGHGRQYVEASRSVKKFVLPFAAPDAFDRAGNLVDRKLAASIGLARKESLTQPEATALADYFQTAFDTIHATAKPTRTFTMDEVASGEAARVAAEQSNVPAGVNVEHYHLLEDALRDVLHTHFNVDGLRMPHDAQEKINKLREFADGLASPAHFQYDGAEMPPELRRALGEIDARGYKVVQGKGIGTMHVLPNQLDVMEGQLTRRRKLVGHMGMTPEVHASRTIGSFRRTDIRNAIQDLADAKRIRLRSAWTPDTVIDYLQRKDILDRSPNSVFGSFVRVTKQAQAEAEQALLAEGMSPEDAARFAKAHARSEIAQALQLRDIPRKKVIEALTDPVKFGRADPEAQAIAAEHGASDWAEIGLFTKREANEIYRAIVKGSAAPPAYMLGATKIDDLFRASMGFVGRGDHDLSWAVANFPNRLVQLRNDLRFSLSPAFSFRRIAKTNVKLALEGVPPTVTPLESMEKAGTLAEDRARLREVFPAIYDPIADDADRYLRENDVFGFYNSRNYEAYALGEWSRAHPEATLDEQHAFLTKTFGYGTRTAEGRSALEMTTNFVFFPFSFEKTLYRNLGGYLLDHPGQMILLTKGLAAYDQMQKSLGEKDPRTMAWWNNHLPVLQEAERLNAFSHGLSLGEPGGLNRPLLNVFLPQSWSSSQNNLDLLHRFVPAVKDLGRIAGEVNDQGQIADAIFTHITGSGKPGRPAPAMEARRAQQDDAFAMQRELYSKYADYIAYNDGRPKTEQARFRFRAGTSAADQWAAWDGEPVTKSTINNMIHAKFPAFDPNAAKFAAENDQRVRDYLFEHKGTHVGTIAEALFDNTNKLAAYMNRGTGDAGAVARYTDAYRKAAIWLAEHDPKFLRLYNKTLRRSLGPLTGVDQHG
ncbi:MAG: hypothetical protein QOK28_2003 [Actinomycetota bacterium]|jgi:hypothetical protein